MRVDLSKIIAFLKFVNDCHRSQGTHQRSQLNMVLDKLIFIFGNFLIFVKWPPVAADVTHGHDLSMGSVQSLENSDNSFPEENMKIFSEVLKIPHDFNKIIHLDIVQLIQSDIVLGSSTEDHLTFDLQTLSSYSSKPSAFLQSSTIETEKDIYIKLQVTKESSCYEDYAAMTIVIGFCLLVLMFKLMNYKSKFKTCEDDNYICNERTIGLMWNLTNSDDFFWKKAENANLQLSSDNAVGSHFEEDNKEVVNRSNEEQSTRNQHHLKFKNQSECSSENRSERMRIFPIAKKLNWSFGIGVVLFVSVATVLAVTSYKQKHVLRVDIPRSAIIRKIRSYTENPDLSAISMNSSSMALVTRLQLLETSCLTDRSRCETYAMCDTELGHLTCRCKRGFYVKDRKCRECATSCPEGYYMLKACTAESDVICRPCSMCTGATYEVAACSSTQDTICIGAAFPVTDVKWNKLIQHSTNTSITVTTSDNVFYEKIGGIKKLESAMYFPNNKQIQAAEVERKGSGLRIKVEVSNLYLVPHYIDLDHEDDFEYINSDTFQLDSNKEQYRKNKRLFCRHQLPDHYKMVLYITRNHTSAAKQITCNSHDPDIPQCPTGYKDGDLYLDRQINKECPHKLAGQKNQYFVGFDQRTNNIFCHHTTRLFTETFGLTPDDISNYTFPTKECLHSTEECKNCLLHPPVCRLEGHCCDIDCYTKKSCQRAYSDRCPKKSVECASGDVHNFLLEPVFSTVDNRFLCHLKYKKPPHLYQLEYSVHMPNIKYTLKKQTKFVKGDRKFNEKGIFKSDFITARHDSLLTLHDEIIFIGSNFNKAKTPTKFHVHGLKQPHQFNTRKKFRVRPHRASLDSSNVYSTHIQLEKPFLYSSKTFYTGGCTEKNFSDIYPSQPIYLPNSVEVDITKRKTGAGFEYQTAYYNDPAYIRISIANTSILTYFQDELGKTEIDIPSLSGGLMWNSWNRTWNIVLEGKLVRCPGYLTVDVYDQFMETKLNKYDVFVKCPVTFHLKFELKTTNTDLPNLFVACINDSFTSHHILLSMIHQPSYPPSKYAVTETNNKLYQFPWTPIIIALCFTAIVFFVFMIVFLCIHRMEPVQGPEVKKYISPQTTTYIGAKDDDRNVNQPLTLTLFSKPVSKSVSCTLCTLYIVYSLMFTFSMMLGVFYVAQGPLVSNLTIVSNTSAKIQQSVGNHMTKISNYEEKELKTAFNQTFNRMKACSIHLKDNIEKIENSLEKDLKIVLKKFYNNRGIVRKGINNTMGGKSQVISEKFDKFLSDSDSMFEEHFSHIEQKYIKLLENFRENEWLRFPKDRFSDQQFIEGEEKTFQGLNDFMRWLELDGVETILEFRNTIKNRLRKSVTDLIPTDLHLSSRLSSAMPKSDLRFSNGNTNRFTFQILEQPEIAWILTNSSDNNPQPSGEPLNENIMSKAKMLDRMKGIILPVFICFFLFMDVLMLFYRFVWLTKILKKAKMGVDIKVPTDHVAEKIQFWQTGNNNRQLEDNSKENPYNFYSENKEDLWSGKNDPIQLYANTAQKSKQEILRELWNKKQKQKRLSYTETKPHSFMFKTMYGVSTFLYKHLIAPILWRFVLVGASILVICLLTKATSDLVSIETATFLIDTKSIIPQLHRQVDITNSLLLDVTSDLNSILKDHKSLVDSEVTMINNFLTNSVNSQNAVLQSLLSDLCHSEDLCTPPILRVQELLTSCNFIPVTTSPFKEMDEGLFVHYLHSELVPLVSTLRQILFNTCYILFVYACLMLVCHMFIRIIIFYLIKTSRLPKAMIYLVSNTNDCWKVNEGSNTKSMYRSNSCIESCESGVVGDIEDHRESNM